MGDDRDVAQAQAHRAMTAVEQSQALGTARVDLNRRAVDIHGQADGRALEHDLIDRPGNDVLARFSPVGYFDVLGPDEGLGALPDLQIGRRVARDLDPAGVDRGMAMSRVDDRPDQRVVVADEIGDKLGLRPQVDIESACPPARSCPCS